MTMLEIRWQILYGSYPYCYIPRPKLINFGTLVPETNPFEQHYLIYLSQGGGGGGGGGGTLIFSHIRRLGPFFGVQNSEFQYFFGFSEK